MNRNTQEMMNLINTLMTFNDNISPLLELFPEVEADIVVIEPYVDYEIKKALKDIIYNERL